MGIRNFTEAPGGHTRREPAPGMTDELAIGLDAIESEGDRTRRLVDRTPKGRRGRLVRRSLLLADVGGLTAAYLIATLLYGEQRPTGRFGLTGELVLFVATLPCWLVVAKLHGLYARDEERADQPTADDVVRVFQLVTIGTWLLLAGSFVTGLADPEISKLIAFWILAVIIVPVTRTIARNVCRRRPAFQQNVLIVGAGDVGQLVARKFILHPEYGINVVGFVDSHPKQRRADLPEHLTILGGLPRLPETIERLGVERVVVAFSHESAVEMISTVRLLRTMDIQVDLVPRLFEVLGPRLAVHSVEGLTLLGLPPVRLTASSRLAKRMIDVVGATVALIATAPVFAYIALRIRLDSPGPVFFRQVRVGTGMREFTLLKFRSMRVGTDSSVHQAYIKSTMSTQAEASPNGMYKLDRSDAITDFGRWLRKTSLDELPQLINVLRGDMSLVGPRPCIPYETELFQPYQLERFLVPQGITGLWQVTARASSSFGEALDMDVAYVRSWSLGLDLRLLLRTPLALARQRSSTA